MNDWVLIILGIMVGIGLGSYFTAIAKPQKPWSELTEKEKKIRLWFFAIAILFLIIGVVVLYLYRKF